MINRKLIYLVLILVLAVSISACRKNTEVVEEEPTTPPVEEPLIEAPEDEKVVIMEEFRIMVEEERASASELKDFIDQNLPVLGQLEGNKMISALEIALIRDLQGVNENLWELNSENELEEIVKDFSANDSNMFPKESIEEISDPDLKTFVKNIFNNHYKLISLEGMFEVIIDYQSLRIYDPKITDEWKEYLALRSIDSENPPFIDGALNINFDSLADRILKTENYLNRYISGERQEELIELYENKLMAYFKGLPNTPIAAYDNKVIFDNVLKSYEKTSMSDGYVTSAMTYLYLEDIRNNNSIIDDNILAKADGYINEAVRTLREYK